MSVAMPWGAIGRASTLIVAWLAAQAVLSIVELYWPGVYKFLVRGLTGLVLVWLIYWRTP